MDISKADDIRVGSVPVQSAWLGGRKVWDRTERKIMRSMVCWYDISRQGCTNEAMAQNPVLKDLSGNGNDMTCYNFAWSGMSGIGGYSWDFTDFTNNYTRTASKVVINTDGSVTYNSNVFQKRIEIEPGYVNRGAKVKVTGITGNGSFDFYNGSTVVSVSQDGEYEVDDYASAEGETYMYYGFKRLDGISAGVFVEIELVPDYPGALVSDGVDDWCFVEGLPALTKEKGYTVIARRRILSTIQGDMGFISKREGNNYGAFLIEKNGGNGFVTQSFGGELNIEKDYSENVIVQTANRYNGVNIPVGNLEDTDFLILCAALKNGNGIGEEISAALYSFLLFDRTLTDAEIDWVKANLVAPPGEDYLRLSDGILLKDGSPLLLKGGSPLALKRIGNTD